MSVQWNRRLRRRQAIGSSRPLGGLQSCDLCRVQPGRSTSRPAEARGPHRPTPTLVPAAGRASAWTTSSTTLERPVVRLSTTCCRARSSSSGADDGLRFALEHRVGLGIRLVRHRHRTVGIERTARGLRTDAGRGGACRSGPYLVLPLFGPFNCARRARALPLDSLAASPAYAINQADRSGQ